MMNGGGRSSSAVDTVNAAASVIAAGDNRSPQSIVEPQKRRWGGFWNLSGCVVTRKQRNRIVDAVLVPDPIAPRIDASIPSETHIQVPPSIVFPFIAPPSSPASFHHSEPSSVTLSPANGLSLDSVSKSMYSPPNGPDSMFAVGPYAHETQLVSPPVPSTYTTEPSTAPFTPPPESVYHLTTPSSPEVPFARLLDPIHQNVETGMNGSGTLSPVLDDECHHHFISVGSGTKTPDPTESLDCVRFLQEHRKSYGSSRSNVLQRIRYSDEEHGNHRLSFEITAEEVMRCVEKKTPVVIGGALNKTLLSSTLHNAYGTLLRDREDSERQQNRRAFSPMSAKEFNFDSVNKGNSSSIPPSVCSNWWANEKVVEIEGNTSTSMAMDKFENHV